MCRLLRVSDQHAVDLGTTAGGNATIVRAGNLLFMLKDDAQLMVARANPGEFEPLKTYTVADSATQGAPAISGNRIFVRDIETLALWTVN